MRNDLAITEVGMLGLLPWSSYQAQADRGIWDNRHAVMSDAALLTYESLSAVARLTKPFLLIHGDNCALPDQATPANTAAWINAKNGCSAPRSTAGLRRPDIRADAVHRGADPIPLSTGGANFSDPDWVSSLAVGRLDAQEPTNILHCTCQPRT